MNLSMSFLTATTQIRSSSGGDRILVALVDPQGNVMILLERLNYIDVAIQSRSFKKVFHQDKIGHTCLFALDESKRMLAVYASARVCPCFFRFISQGFNPAFPDAASYLRI